VFRLNDYIHAGQLIIPNQEIEVRITGLVTSGDVIRVGVQHQRVVGDDVASEINEVVINFDTLSVKADIFTKGKGVGSINVEGEVIEVY
jgi:hypothetical protein